MPKFFCDYCDVYLTHDSMSVRKAHNSGRNHLRNVQAYYEQISNEKAQSVIDSITASYSQGGPEPQAPGGIPGQMPQFGMPLPIPGAQAPPFMAMPPQGTPGNMPPFQPPNMPGGPPGGQPFQYPPQMPVSPPQNTPFAPPGGMPGFNGAAPGFSAPPMPGPGGQNFPGAYPPPGNFGPGNPGGRSGP